MAHSLFQSAEALAHVFAYEVDGSEVGKLHVQITLCSPSSFVVVFLQSQFVDPYLARFGVARQVSHTDNHRLHLAKRRVTHDAHLIARFVLIIVREQLVVGSMSLRLCPVTLLLQLREDVERDIEHIVFRPHHAFVLSGVFVVVSRRSEFQRNLVFIEITLIVTTQPDEHRQLVVGQVSCVFKHGIGVYEHLQTTILSEVERRVLVYRLRLARPQVLHHHVERLFITLHQLRLSGVLCSVDARRQHVVHRLFVVILLDVYGAH